MAQFRKDTHEYLKDGKTIFEVVMLSDQYGNLVGPANPSGMAVDAFGRARMSQPFTLFDSFHRYQDNGKTNTANSASGATLGYNANSSTVTMTVDTTSGSYMYRESSRVFAYQPGKSLLILQTYVLSPKKTGLRQRFGYFGTQNGVYLEIDGTGEPTFKIRSNSTGTLQYESAAQSSWNVDPLDGTGPSKLTLDMTKTQIQWIDIEWLGVGSVRVGFVINGQFIHCHTFHHANIANTTYMTTACLPIRAEIENTATTASNSTLSIICSTVISEGGYEPRGKTRTYGMDPAAIKTITAANTYYPIVSIRINPDKPDSIVIPKQIDVLPTTADNYRWVVASGGTWTGDTWANVAADSSVQYQSNASATISGYTIMNSGYVTSTVQGGGALNMTDGDMFRYQLERNSFANTYTSFTLLMTSAKNTSNVSAGMSWLEIT